MLFGLLMVGCTSWIDREPACGKDVYSWSDDLLSYLLTGDGSGEFDFDPEDVPRGQVAGAYKPKSGDFDYETTYTGEFYISSSETSGFGTVYHNGDLDLLYETLSTDRLDEEFTNSYRVERQACKMTISSWAGESDATEAGVFTQTGEYTDDSTFEWTYGDGTYSWSGANRRNQSSTVIVEANDGSYFSKRSYVPEGTASEEWEGPCGGDYTCAGVTDTRFNGDVVQDYSAFDGNTKIADMHWEYDYGGGGTGTGTFYDGNSTIECSYEENSNGKCTYSCDDGSDGTC
jgi:hypothetical protein